MLSLPIKRLASLITIDDDALPSRVYAALARPRVARAADGGARLRLLRWTAAAGDAAVTGARLSLEAELHPTAEDIAAAGLAGREVLPLPWLDARVRLDGPGFEPVEAEVALATGARAHVAVDLSPATAALLAPLLQADAVLPLQLTWSGHVWMRLPALEVVASADVHEVRRRIEMVGGVCSRSVMKSVLDANAHIEIRGNADAELEAALRNWALDELGERLTAGGELSMRASAADVVRWPVELATTLDDSMPAASRRELVQTVVLDAGELGRVPPIEVRVFGDFARTLERVDVKLQALQGARGVDLSFSESAVQPAPLGSTGYRWCWRSKIKDQPVGDWSASRDVHGSSSLLLSVPRAPATGIEVLAAGLDFGTRWSSVRVVLTYQEPGVAPVSGSVELDAAHCSVSWTLPPGAAGSRGQVTARLAFVSRQGSVIDSETAVEGEQLVVRDPLDRHRLRFCLAPAGSGWADLALAMVDLRYVDGAYTIDETVELHKLDDFVEWEVPARPDGPRNLRWRLHASFRDGRFTSGAWQSSEAGVIVVRIEGTPRRDVQVLPVYFDATRTRAAHLRLRSGVRVEEVVLTDRTPRAVQLPPGPFTWTLAWTAADGSEWPESARVDGNDVIVLPRFEGGG